MECADKHNNTMVADKLKVGRKRIREWRSKKEQLKTQDQETNGANRKGIGGGGREPLDTEIEDQLL